MDGPLHPSAEEEEVVAVEDGTMAATGVVLVTATGAVPALQNAHRVEAAVAGGHTLGPSPALVTGPAPAANRPAARSPDPAAL